MALSARVIPSKGLRQTRLESLGGLNLQAATAGDLRIQQDAIDFNAWHIEYGDLLAAEVDVSYAFGFPNYLSRLTDSKASYQFVIPRAHMRTVLPFEVATHGVLPWWRRGVLVPMALAVFVVAGALRNAI
jgi:hypothetical protein